MHSRCWLHSLVRQSRYKIKKEREWKYSKEEERGRERGGGGVRGDAREELRGCTQSDRVLKEEVRAKGEARGIRSEIETLNGLADDHPPSLTRLWESKSECTREREEERERVNLSQWWSCGVASASWVSWASQATCVHLRFWSWFTFVCIQSDKQLWN